MRIEGGRSEIPISETPDHQKVRSFNEWLDNGLLWLINTTVFHPRGYALGLGKDQFGNVMGWELFGDGTEPWQFACDDTTKAMLEERFEQVNRTLPQR